MRAFPSSRGAAGRLASIPFAGWIALMPAVLAAQQLGPPIPLIPPPAEDSPNMSPPGSRADDAVASEPLAPTAAGWSSATPPPRDVLPGSSWRGTSRSMADLLLARLPDTTSPALQALARRLLLSPAAGPEGPDAGDDRLPALRAGALLRLGELEAARAVVAAIPEQERDTALPLAVAADAIGGDVGHACATVRETVRRDQGVFWQTALIACQALQGETEQARLGLQLLAEDQQTLGTDLLAAAVEALAGQPPAAAMIGRTDALDPLSLRLLVAARWDITAAVVDRFRPDLALCLALDEEAPSATRLAAAERAARYGALSPDHLRTLYSTLTDPSEKSDATALGHARRFAAIAQADSPAEHVARIAGFADALGGSQAGGQAGGFTLAARLVLPVLRQIEPDPSLVGWAPLAARLLIAAGDVRAAGRWGRLLSGSEGGSLRLLLGLAAPREELVRDHPNSPPPLPFLTLASALGEPMPSTDWAALPATVWTVAGPPSPPPAAWLDLADATRGKRIAETALGAIMVASPAGILAVDPVALFTAVSGLKQVGLESDARRLAVEAALAAGL
jgi:hypothetical protein